MKTYSQDSKRRRLTPYTFLCIALMFYLLLLCISAEAQTLDDAVRGALNNNCVGLGGGLGPYGPNLDRLCLGIGGGGGGAASTTAGGSITLQTRLGLSDDEGRALRRLKERRDAERSTDAPAASADSRWDGVSFSPGASADNRWGGVSFFVSGDYEGFDKRLTRFEPGYDSDSFGGTVGADYSFRERAVVGVALNYARVDGTFDSSGGTFETDSYGLMLYGSLIPFSNAFIDLVGGYTHKEFSIERKVLLGNINGLNLSEVARISSEPNANEYRVGVRLGYDVIIKNVTVGPRVGVNYKHTTIGSFAERGHSGLELAYDRQHEDSLTTVVGLYGSIAISLGFGVIIPQTTLEYIHEFERDQRVIYFRFGEDFNRTKLRFQNDPPDRDYFNVSIGAVLALPGAITPFVNYRALLGYRDQSSHAVTVGLRYAF